MDTPQLSRYWWILLLFVLLIGGGLGIAKWRSNALATADQASLIKARSELKHHPQRVLAAYAQSRGHGFPGGHEAQWQKLNAQALFHSGDIRSLTTLYGTHPDAIHGDEAMSLAVYRLLTSSGYTAVAKQLREQWRGREQDPWGWLQAEAAGLAFSNHISDALALVKHATLPSQQEADRQLLLARLSDDPQQRLRYLSQATRLDPQHPGLRQARAIVLENSRQPRQALYELQRWIAQQPDALEPRLALANFYIRQRQSARALRIWEQLSSRSPEAWIRARIWSKLVQPLEQTLTLPTPLPDEAPDGPNGQLIQALNVLPTDHFFDDEAFKNVNESANSLQELRWLQLLADLKHQHYRSALDRLRTLGDEQTSYNPFVLHGLCQLLHQRIDGRLDSLACPTAFNQQQLQRLPYLGSELMALEQAQKSQQLASSPKAQEPLTTELLAIQQLSEQPAAFSAVLLSGGWREAALRLGEPRTDLPEWLQRLWLAALRDLRGTEAALAYLDRLPPSPNPDTQNERAVLRAEWSLNTEQREQAIVELASLAKLKGVNGARATDLLARTQMEAGRFNDALRTILANSEFAASLAGHELAARIYLTANDPNKADAILKRIVNVSVLAKEVLATRAWQQHRYADAAALLTELIQQFPERTDLRSSLHAVLKAQQ